MRFSSIGAAFTLGAALSLSACGGSASAGFTGESTTTTTTSPAQEASLRFDDDAPLTLSPGSAASIGVTADPTGPYTIGFSLAGDVADAWIELPTVRSDATGHAVDILHAPTQATNFHIRASILDDTGAPGATADREIVVSGDVTPDTASVEVAPDYQGKRPVKEWSIAVVADQKCADIQANLPDLVPPSALVATAPFGETALVSGVPVGELLAVVVRAGHFAVGCATVDPLAPEESLSVSVTVMDVALDLGAPLSTHLTYDMNLGVASIMADAAQLLGEGFLPSGGKDGSVLLNAMAAIAPQTLSASFAAQRVAGGWDSIAAQHFAALPVSPRDQLELWAATGLGLQSPTLDLTLTPGAVPNVEAVTVDFFGNIPGAAVAPSAGVTFTWSAEPNDQVLLSGTLPWSPAGLAGAASLAAATHDYPGLSTVAQALSTVTRCADLATQLGPFPGCDVGCVKQLCDAAVEARFNAALAAGDTGKLTVNATATADVGDTAQATALSGAWIGELGVGIFSVKVKGDLTAQAN